MDRTVLAWFLLVVFLVGSFAAPVCSSRVGGRSVWAAAGDATLGNDDGSRASYYAAAYRGGKKIWNMRSLGTRTTRLSPPTSNKMRAAAVPAPPSPPTTKRA
jgi:hypothetical protein